MMKRRALKLLLLLLAGAIINVVVAWACVLNAWSFGGSVKRVQISQWPRPVPGDFPPSCEVLLDDGKYGFRQMLASVEGEWKPIEHNVLSRHHWSQGIIQSGLPCLSLESTIDCDTRRPSNQWSLSGIEPPTWLQNPNDLSVRLGTVPLFPGFAINTMFYAAVLWVLFAVLGRVRRWRRIKRGQCASCGYSLRESVSEKCPECGATVCNPAGSG